ncbi:MAG: UDP-N-acetylglucosamine acyltransferase [Parvicella sp.]
MIHERAIVHPGAKIGKDVSIGPFSMIEDNVTIGDGTVIGPHVVVRNHTHIGEENHFFQFSSIGEAPQYRGFKQEPTTLKIGDRNTFREYVTLNRGTPDYSGETVIGNDNFIMAYVHIAHDCVIGNDTTFANGASLAGHVKVGDYAILGGFSLIHQFCSVGAHCITGIGAVCFQDVPPFIVAAGNSAAPYGINTKGLKRRGFSDDTVTLLKAAYKLLYRSNLDLKSAMDKIANLDATQKDLQCLLAFLGNSDRGIIRR